MGLSAVERIAAEHAAARDAELARVGEGARRRAQGIVHTPPELARGVLRVSDELLRQELGLARGLGDPGLLVLDPACGPGAFLAAALALAPGPLRAAGFDIDASALARAAQLSAHAPGSALELQQADVLAGDALLARAAAHRGPILVTGNPPWTSARALPTAADQARLDPFRLDHAGAPLGERKLGVLSDAYVRFFALCAELAVRCEQPVLVALVTNGSFLDGPVHRGLRARFVEWFDATYVLDLGGSALLGRRREQRDDNVFGVRPGVAISWLCRRAGPRAAAPGRVHHARLYGERGDKLAQLSAASLRQLGFAPLAPEPPALLLRPRRARAASYAAYPALPEWLPFHQEGVQSNRDAVVVDEDRERLLERLRAFARGQAAPGLEQALRPLPHYDPARARRQLAAALERGGDGELVQRIAYRPFDARWFCPVTPLCHRPRPELARALGHAPGALVSVRKDRGDLPWTHAAYSGPIIDNCLLSARSSCRARAFPLRTPEGAPNLGEAVCERLAAVCGELPEARAVQAYLLCILSARSYRERWDSELHLDYPRVPLPPDAATFRALAALGERIAALHAEPLAPVRAPEPPAGCLHRALQLSAADGSLRLHGEPLVAAPELPAVGHHRPLSALLAARAARPLDRGALGKVLALAERLAQLAAAHAEADAAVRIAFAADWVEG